MPGVQRRSVAPGGTPGFGVEPGAGDAPLDLTISESARKGLYAYLDDMRISGAAASRRPGSRGESAISSSPRAGRRS